MKRIWIYVMLCLIGFCAESLKADNVYLPDMIEQDFSMADELFKPKVPISNQGRRPSSQLNWSVRANNTAVVGKKEKYAYKSIGAGVSAGGSAVASSGRVNENEYRAQIPVMSSFGMGEPMMQEMMLKASSPPGNPTGSLAPIDDEIPVLLLLLVGYCFWVWQRRKVYSK